MRHFLLPLMMVFAMSNAVAQGSTPRTPAPGSPERAAILDAARAPAEQELGKPVRFLVQAIHVLDGWAFVNAEMQDSDGRPLDYAGTRYQAAAEHGMKSKRYVALLHDEHGTWTVRAYKVGPTDLAWDGWDQEYGAPAALFQNPH